MKINKTDLPELNEMYGAELRAHNFETDKFEFLGYISSIDLDREEMTVHIRRVLRK